MLLVVLVVVLVVIVVLLELFEFLGQRYLQLVSEVERLLVASTGGGCGAGDVQQAHRVGRLFR